jgi:hypothetical protein
MSTLRFLISPLNLNSNREAFLVVDTNHVPQAGKERQQAFPDQNHRIVKSQIATRKTAYALTVSQP